VLQTKGKKFETQRAVQILRNMINFGPQTTEIAILLFTHRLVSLVRLECEYLQKETQYTTDKVKRRFLNWEWLYPTRGATTAKKLRGSEVWVPTKARLGVGCGRGSSPPAVRIRGYHPGITPEKFLKTQMLNPALWWLLNLLWNFLLFENYGQEVGDQYIVGPPT